MVVDEEKFKDAFDKTKALGTDATDEEIRALLHCVDFSSQSDYISIGGVLIPTSYVDDIVQRSFDNNPLLIPSIEDRFIIGASEREPIGLLNERNEWR